MQAFGRNQISVQVSGFGFQDLGFADTYSPIPDESSGFTSQHIFASCGEVTIQDSNLKDPIRLQIRRATYLTGSRKSVKRAEAVAGNPHHRCHRLTSRLQKGHLRKKFIITPAGGCQAGSQNMIAKQKGFCYLNRLSRTRPDRCGHRLIDDFREASATSADIGTASSPAERDFAVLNLLFCGKLKNRINQIRDIFHGGPQ